MNYKRIRKRNICFDVRVKFIDTDFRFCVNFIFFNNQNLGVSFKPPCLISKVHPERPRSISVVSVIHFLFSVSFFLLII